jgi:cytosine/adenosine deaminase-related metal-dependent hydrolase
MSGTTMIGQYVVVRTYSAGVHVGILAARDGKEVVLREARRVWRWRGANTLSEMARHGITHEYSRVAETVTEILLTEAIEIIPTTRVAEDLLRSAVWSA